MTLGTKEWADSNVNCYNGCSHDCRYCYAKKNAIRFGRKTLETWSHMDLNEKIAKKSFKKRKGRIMFPSSHDIPNNKEIIANCIAVLKKILIPGNEVLITTKPHPQAIYSICQELREYKDQIQFRFTITSINNHLLKYWEPNAPTFHRRLESLIMARKLKFKTSVSIEPFLDRDPTALLKEIYRYTTGSIWIGPMSQIQKNGLTGMDAIYHEQIRKNYTKDNLKTIARAFQKLDKIMYKDAFRNKVEGKKN